MASSDTALNRVSKRLSGEKPSHWLLSLGVSKVWHRSRVTPSETSVVMVPNSPWACRATAMNLPQGDHTAVAIGWLPHEVATVGPHEVDSPYATLARGEALDS